MARYTDADCRLCRRQGIKLFLKGSKCESPKCPVDKRGTPPGQHGRARTRGGKESPYGVRLKEKQKARRIYGVLERQFRIYYDMAARQKGATGENLLRLLERRLDNVLFRAGFASSRDDARQMVGHRHILVNGVLTFSPSFLVRPGDVVALKAKSVGLDRVAAGLEFAERRTRPSWLSVDVNAKSATVATMPNRAEIDAPVKETLIVEFYSR